MPGDDPSTATTTTNGEHNPSPGPKLGKKGKPRGRPRKNAISAESPGEETFKKEAAKAAGKVVGEVLKRGAGGFGAEKEDVNGNVKGLRLRLMMMTTRSVIRKRSRLRGMGRMGRLGGRGMVLMFEGTWAGDG